MQVSDEVIKILEYLCDKIGITIDWTNNNVLPYVEQLCENFIMWEVSTSFAWMGIMCVVTIIALILAIKIHNTVDLDGFEWLIFGIILTTTITVCGVQIFDIIECKTFPEKAIYDYIHYQLNNGGR